MEKISHTFDYELMNTSLHIVLPNIDEQYAKSASYDCYCKLEIVEDLISMYRSGSDIAMLNEQRVGGIVKIADSTYECLMSAFNASVISKGVIDVCMGEYFLKAKNDTFFPKIETPRKGKFAFDAENYLVQKLEDGMIDLGAIGKGFALERIEEILTEDWDIKNVFVSFGGSSIFAKGVDQNGDNWQINLSENISLPLNNAYVGASGTAVLGSHIIDCRNGEVPQNMPYRTWAFTPSGAISDAMSTAFMILSPEEIKEICKQYEFSGAIQQTPDSEIDFLGTI
ncbi:MAG: FAD:protein FMN transferase [Verrucomicrobiaceae bacterium]|nr:FAD:protein FMN transferase [Verrucomicrobiaceae bacterium]